MEAYGPSYGPNRFGTGGRGQGPRDQDQDQGPGTLGPPGQGTLGPVGQGTLGPVGQGTLGPVGQGTLGPVGPHNNWKARRASRLRLTPGASLFDVERLAVFCGWSCHFPLCLACASFI